MGMLQKKGSITKITKKLVKTLPFLVLENTLIFFFFFVNFFFADDARLVYSAGKVIFNQSMS